MKVTAHRLTESQLAQLANQYQPGDVVEYGDGNYGVVLDAMSSAFEWPKTDGVDDEYLVNPEGDEEGVKVDASPDSPMYIVALEDGGSKPMSASEFEKTDKDNLFSGYDVDPVETAKEASDELSVESLLTPKVAELVSLPGVDDPGVGWDDYPDSWEEAETPARVILLDAWTSMGATWRGAYQELKSKRLASATKDEVYGTTAWRSWDD